MSKLTVSKIFIFIICCWHPFQLFILRVDGGQRSILILFIMFLLIYLERKSLWVGFLKTPIILWFIWAIYAFINTIIKGYTNSAYYPLFMELFIPVFIMIAINANGFKDKLSILNTVILGLYFNLILLLIFHSNLYSLRDYPSSINANEIGVTAIVLTVTLYLKYLYQIISLRKLIILEILPVIFIYLSGSRNAFGALLIIIIGFFLIRSYQSRYKFIRLIFGLTLAFSVYLLTINYTPLGERIVKTEEQADNKNQDSGTVFDKLGDRGVFYILGYEVFLSHPISGVGLYNYVKFSGHNVQHSEYMIQLSELGIIGTILFILFYFSILKRLFHVYKKQGKSDKSIVMGYILTIVIILFMAISTRVFNSIYFFIILGLSIAFTLDKQQRIQVYK